MELHTHFARVIVTKHLADHAGWHVVIGACPGHSVASREAHTPRMDEATVSLAPGRLPVPRYLGTSVPGRLYPVPGRYSVL
jgi:hypothetical protein